MERDTRKFKSVEKYQVDNEIYSLLPFRFHSIDEEREVLVNEIGDYLLVPSGTAASIAGRRIDRSSSLYRDLVANFFISIKPVPDLLDLIAARYRTKHAFLHSFTSLHIFVVTLRCNHTCHYCQVSRATENKVDFDISYQDIDAGIEHIFKSASEDITVEFQGGEPLLAFEKVRYTVERILEQNKVPEFRKHIQFVICSNLTVIDEQILSFCKTHEILLSTSLDGPAFIHNSNRFKNRSGSYESVIEGISRARSVLGNDRVSALMTTSTLSLKYPKEIIDSYLENGFHSIFLRPVSPYGFAVKNKKKNAYHTDEFLKFYKEGLEYILELNKGGISIREDYTTILLQKLLTPFATNYVDLQSPTGLVSNVVVFNYDGFVYASDEARMLAEIKDYTFRLGHVSEPYEDLFFGKKAQQILNAGVAESLAGCSECAFLAYCGTDPVLNYATQNDMQGHRASSIFCKKNMEIFKHLFRILDSGVPEIESIFRSWVYQK